MLYGAGYMVETHLIVQARPEAVVDVPAPSLLNNEPSESVLEALNTVVYGHTCARRIGIGLPIAIRTVWFADTGLSFSFRSLLLMFFDLRIQAGDDAFETTQTFQKFRIWWLPALPRGSARSREDTVNLGAHTIGAWVLLVAFDLAPAAGDARSGVRRWAAVGGGTTNTTVALLCTVWRIAALWRVLRHVTWNGAFRYGRAVGRLRRAE